MGIQNVNCFLTDTQVLQTYKTHIDQPEVMVTVEIVEDENGKRGAVFWGGAVKGYFLFGVFGMGVVGITPVDDFIETLYSLENISKLF